MNSDAQLILVVEDDDASRSALLAGLKGAGYETIEAPNGEAGLTLALEKHPAIIVSDNLMPVKTGAEFLADLRQDTWGATVPFILLTGQFDMEAVNDSLEAGKSDYLIKDDTSLSDLIATVERRLQT